LLSLILFILVLGVLVLVHELGHFFAARRVGVRVEKFSFGFGPKLFSVKRGDTEYIISLFPLGGYVKMAGDEPGEKLAGRNWEYFSKSVFERFAIIFAGPLLNYILAFFIFSVIFMFGSPTLTTEIGALMDGYPAKAAGLEIGDKIVAVDGKNVKYWEDMTEMIRNHVNGPMRVSAERGGRAFEKDIAPIVRRTKDIFGSEVKLALIGVGPAAEKMERVRYNPAASLYMGAKKLWGLTRLTYKALWAMATGRMPLKDSVTGPIGIFIITEQVAKMGFVYLLNLIGILSASLAIFNVLPLPVLDGGNIMFLALEKLMGRPLSMKMQELIANIGWGIIIVLTVFIFYSDIVKFGIFEKVMKVFKR